MYANECEPKEEIETKKKAKKRKVSNLNGCFKSAMDKEAVEIRVLSNGKIEMQLALLGKKMQKHEKSSQFRMGKEKKKRKIE